MRNPAVIAAVALLLGSACLAEDGYQLWLRYPQQQGVHATQLDSLAKDIVIAAPASPALDTAITELTRGLAALSGHAVPTSRELHDGSIVVATADSPLLVGTALPTALLKPEGFVLKAQRLQGKQVLVLAARNESGLLYGSFELLRQLQTSTSVASLDLLSNPALQVRALNHWDNLDRKVERGYAGQSLWDWWKLPGVVDQRYRDYARANASLGINAVVLNNVNANARILTEDYLHKVAAIANSLRPFGQRVFLSARFSAPKEIGGLPTADPLDAAVQAWWQQKADEIYRLIPDFGGFLVKANSEGQPGPGDYGRTHAEGANMLAAAVGRHGGIVMWRAFVYSDVNPEDRAKQAFSEFQPLDGKFASNVLVQVKNGPIDFQPREPFHPLFGAMPKTALMPELQLTKEYLGFATHLVYLGPLFEEVLQADTFTQGSGSTVASIASGSYNPQLLTGMAGVANIGTDRDWSGSDFNQANWYVFGRLAWNPQDSSARIAREWLTQTFSSDPRFLDEAVKLMQRSREAAVDYMTPLGLAHLMGTSHHYGPAPWVSDQKRPEWNPVYYHRADDKGIGFDRTASGSNALAQYAAQAAAKWSNPASIDERYLLWFHHLPWQWNLKNGQTVWEAMITHYDHGVEEVRAMALQWKALEPYVDKERFDKAQQLLDVQYEEALWWRDASIAYFMSVSKLPLPAGVRKPPHSLEYYQSLVFVNPPG